METSFMNATPKQIAETYRIFEDIIDNLDEAGLNELFQAEAKDIDKLFMSMMDEIYGVTYTGKIETDVKPFYVNSLEKEMEEILRKENLLYFITSVMPEFILNWHHIEWAQLCAMYKKLCILAARGHGKSFFFSNAYAAWKLYGYSVKSQTSRPKLNENANRRGFLFSFSILQAVDLLSILKTNIEENPILKERLFPIGNEGWGKIDIICRNGARLTVRGVGASVRGPHPGWIIGDDILKDNSLYSSVQRKKVIDWWHSVPMNMIVKGGDVKVVGTPFHANDFYGDLKSPEKSKIWTVREYPAIFPNGDLLWEEMMDYKTLMEKRKSEGNMNFSRESLCRPVTNESSIFPPEIIAKAFFNMGDVKFVRNRDSYPKKFIKVVTGCDFSISANIGADWTVFITAGVDEEERLWLMNLMRFKGKTLAEQLAILKQINANFRPDCFMLETNAFQQIFSDEAAKQGLPVVGHHTGKEKYDFKMGIPGLALAFERGMIKIPRGDQNSVDIGDTISLELSAITWTEKGLGGVGEHDDVGMALWQTWLAGKHAGGMRFRFLG